VADSSDTQSTVTLDDFLASLAGGPVHSSGAFTISEQAAREKLARFTLVHPSLYLLELVGVAVLGGARQFEVLTQGQDTLYRFDGEPLTAQDCHNALGQMFETSSSRRLGCLGLALTTAHGLAGRDLVVGLPEGTFTFDGERFSLQSSQGTGGETEIRVPGRFGFFTSSRRDATLEETLRLTACSAMQITLDGRQLSYGWRPDRPWTIAALWRWTNENARLKWDCSTVHPTFEEPSPGDFSAILALMPDTEAAKNGLTVVHLGVSYRVRDPEFNIPGVCAVVRADGLERNLSRSEILWNPAYLSLREQLKLAAQKLIWATLNSAYRLTTRFMACQPSVEWAFESRRQQGVESSAAASWLAIAARLRNHPTPQVLADLAIEQDRLGNPRKAEDFRLAAIERLVENFRQLGRNRNLEKNFMVWTPLLRELVDRLEDSQRKVYLKNFLALIEPRRSTDNLPVEQETQRLRLLGRTSEAVELLPQIGSGLHLFSNKIPIEVLLAVPRSKEALNELLRQVRFASVDEALSGTWPSYYRLHRALLADILEYRNDRRALKARQLCIKHASNGEMLYLTTLEMCRHARAKGSIALWIKARAAASYHLLTQSMTMIEHLTTEHPLIAGILDGKVFIPKDVDGFLLPLCDRLGYYGEVLPYLTSRLAHRLRLAGEYQVADQLLARLYTLRAMDHSLQGL
jgi:hypothetical protein